MQLPYPPPPLSLSPSAGSSSEASQASKYTGAGSLASLTAPHVGLPPHLLQIPPSTYSKPAEKGKLAEAYRTNRIRAQVWLDVTSSLSLPIPPSPPIPLPPHPSPPIPPSPSPSLPLPLLLHMSQATLEEAERRQFACANAEKSEKTKVSKHFCTSLVRLCGCSVQCYLMCVCVCLVQARMEEILCEREAE